MHIRQVFVEKVVFPCLCCLGVQNMHCPRGGTARKQIEAFVGWRRTSRKPNRCSLSTVKPSINFGDAGCREWGQGMTGLEVNALGPLVFASGLQIPGEKR